MDVKVCRLCKFPLPIEQFPRGCGKGGRIARCRRCKYVAERARKGLPSAVETIWTPELTAKLREFMALNITLTEIAGRLGLTKNQVVGKVSRDGLANSRSRKVPFTTTAERLDALHAKLDAVLNKK